MSIDQVRSIRDSGLLPPARRIRGRSGNVAYHHEHVERLSFIERALAMEFSREDIAALTDRDRF